jgi:RNA polymerase sigma factor (TIGR02999 family)
MPDITRLLDAAATGDPQAAAAILPLVYDEPRKLAAARLAREPAGHTLDATALVHEAYLRLVASGDVSAPRDDRRWASRGHFFAAAAEAMRRILVESARRKRRHKHGGGRRRVDAGQLDIAAAAAAESDEDLLAVDEALDRLAVAEPEAAAVVKLRYFAGLTVAQAAAALGVSVRTANRHWAYAKAWLHQQLHRPDAATER